MSLTRKELDRIRDLENQLSRAKEAIYFLLEYIPVPAKNNSKDRQKLLSFLNDEIFR